MPLNALTDIDKKTIQQYIYYCQNVANAPIDKVLSYWNKNKRTLFKAFGRQLKVSKQIKIPRDSVMYQQELFQIYQPHIIHYEGELSIFCNYNRCFDLTKNKFLAHLYHYFCTNFDSIEDAKVLTSLFSYRNIEKGYVVTESRDGYHFKSFKCTIKYGMKIMRTIQKVLKASRFPYMDLFEEWKNKINLLGVNQDFSTKLVLSIHPIDFMTMSDNNCHWSSCMSWTSNGCYSAGILEMMNSNVAVVAYLENPQPYILETDQQYEIPNKSWRSLVFIHKNIILVGKNYPYYNEYLCNEILNFVKELVYKNLKWTYQFNNQQYYDMIHTYNNFYMRNYFNVNYNVNKKHHNIFIYTYGMYNDIIEDTGSKYWCCRNKVKKSLKLCLSGPATCVCCGEPIMYKEDIYSSNDLGSDCVCYECRHNNTCRCCNIINPNNNYQTKYGTYCSEDCLKEMIYFPGLKTVISNSYFLNNKEKYRNKKHIDLLTHIQMGGD